MNPRQMMKLSTFDLGFGFDLFFFVLDESNDFVRSENDGIIDMGQDLAIEKADFYFELDVRWFQLAA